MKDKSPVEQLQDKVAKILTELLDFIEPFIMIAYRIYKKTNHDFKNHD